MEKPPRAKDQALRESFEALKAAVELNKPDYKKSVYKDQALKESFEEI